MNLPAFLALLLRPKASQLLACSSVSDESLIILRRDPVLTWENLKLTKSQSFCISTRRLYENVVTYEIPHFAPTLRLAGLVTVYRMGQPRPPLCHSFFGPWLCDKILTRKVEQVVSTLLDRPLGESLALSVPTSNPTCVSHFTSQNPKLPLVKSMNKASIDDVAALQVAISASFSLMVMIVDFMLLIRDEVKVIWPRLGCWYARLYILARYVGLASQVFNVYFTARMWAGIPATPTACRVWFVYQAIVVQSLLASVDAALMHRIYALFLRSRSILMLLVVFAAGQVASMGVSARFSVPSVQHTDTCMIVKSHPGNAYFGATAMTTNIVILFMTLWKFIRLPLKWTRRGIGRVVFRDSALSVLAISVAMLFLTLCSLGIIRPTISGNISYYWFVCILWVSLGRIIVNHEKLAQQQQVESSFHLSSQIEIGEGWLDDVQEHQSLPSQ